MGFQLRKLAYDSSPVILPEPCDDNDCNESCDSSKCVQFCPQLCHPSPHSKLPTKYLIIISTLLTLSFLILCFYVYYVRCFKRRSSITRLSQRNETTETRDEFLDEDHGPVVDHHIWHINTVGLQPSIVNSIAVCKYVKGEGLVDGTECSVCLTEFEEDETLRLLPKCSHAFHVNCIDTWLRAHTNCPVCRAPIVSNMADKGSSSSESSEVNTEGTRVVIMEDDEESVRETEGGSGTSVGDELGVENEGNIGESSVQAVRRSVSLDSMAASEISQALANNNGSNLDNGLNKGKESSLRFVSRRGVTGNQGLLRLMCHSSIGRSLSMRPIFMKRSFSCNGKFSLPISNNNENLTPNRNRNPPLRSF